MLLLQGMGKNVIVFAGQAKTDFLVERQRS